MTLLIVSNMFSDWTATFNSVNAGHGTVLQSGTPLPHAFPAVKNTPPLSRFRNFRSVLGIYAQESPFALLIKCFFKVVFFETVPM